MLKANDVVICTDASGGIIGWLTQDKEYIVEWVFGVEVKLMGYEYTTKQWRFKLKEPK